jgi:response regulator RpfG family c-di-GMP phosphodiesterase
MFFPQQGDRFSEMIFKYITRVEKERNLDSTLVALSEMARDLISSDRCTLWLFNEEKNTFWTKIAHGLLEDLEVDADKGTISLARQMRQPFIIKDPYSHPNFFPAVDSKTGYLTRNILVVPIFNHESEIIGVYQAVNKKDGDFTDQDVNYLKLVAGYSSEIINSALLFKEIEDTQKELIYRMGDIAEAKSKETGNHIKRVAEYTSLLAEGYGLPKIDVEIATLASPMHDIGKIAIPDEILHKPGKLTPEEFEVMKTHTTVGFELLKFSKRKILKAAAIIAHQHHEKWDGAGYPRKIAGKEIHIFGRILAVADVFDALIGDRCYKKAWPLEKVVQEFKTERGRHFDPNLVDIFLQSLDDFVAVKEKYLDQFTYPEKKKA